MKESAVRVGKKEERAIQSMAARGIEEEDTFDPTKTKRAIMKLKEAEKRAAYLQDQLELEPKKKDKKGKGMSFE